MVNVLLHDYVSLPLTELPELPELILDVLATVPGAHAAIDGYTGWHHRYVCTYIRTQLSIKISPDRQSIRAVPAIAVGIFSLRLEL